MAIAQSTQPTILERGEVFSQGIMDYPGQALTQVKEQFVIPTSMDPVGLIFCTRLRFLRSRVFLLLDSAHARLKILREQLGKISQQLSNGTNRYDDLPNPPVPFEHHGPTEDINKIRQKILDERARLLEEERRLNDRYWTDITDLKAQVAEALAEYVSLASRIESHTNEPVPVPAISDLFAFLEAPAPEEVVIPQPPIQIESSLLERIP